MKLTLFKPAARLHHGLSVRLAPLTIEHAPDLWDACRGADETWRYMKSGPFEDYRAFQRYITDTAYRTNQLYFSVFPRSSEKAEGWLSYCDVRPEHAAVEIGSVWYSPSLQRTRAATEATYLLIAHAFELGYQRVAWQCNARNKASRQAAERLGFGLEGVLRGVEIVKGQRRDTAWFSIMSDEWAVREDTLKGWLSDDNFDDRGVSRSSLSQAMHDALSMVARSTHQ